MSIEMGTGLRIGIESGLGPGSFISIGIRAGWKKGRHNDENKIGQRDGGRWGRIDENRGGQSLKRWERLSGKLVFFFIKLI